MKTAFWLIGIFFLLLTGGLAYTLKLALDHSEPILDEKYYEKGLDYQAHIDAREKAVALGYRLEGEVFDASSLPRGKQSLSWTLVVPQEQNLKPEDVEFRVTLDQPATSKYRQVVNIAAADIQQENGNLVFQKEIDIARPGYWDVIIEGQMGDLYVHRSQRLAVQ